MILSISSTVLAIEECAIKLGFRPIIEITEPIQRGSLINRKVTAKTPEGEPLGKIEYRLENDGQKLFITYVTRSDSARNVGLQKVMFQEILNHNPNVQMVDANLMQINALVIDKHYRQGMPLSQAVLKSPTGSMLFELGFKRILVLKDYSFHNEGAYHLLISR